ncbi:2-methoxy-6-polyprenyl-1,4-benzoquinol methylase [subsurface metagenome]
MSSYSEYDPFARVYNQHWGNRFIPLILPILENHILQHLPAKAHVLDLCCGTGQLAQRLIEHGYQVTGLDGSKEMLKFARENAPAAEFILADARSFQLPDIYHAVISTFDSLNHIMELEELTTAFRNVHAALRPGGLFLFDLNLEAGYKADWNDNFGIVEEDHVCVIRSSYHPEERTARFEATIFHMDNDWQRSDLTLMQKCYSQSEILSALAAAGFIKIHAYASDLYKELVALTEDAERGFFICQKPL